MWSFLRGERIRTITGHKREVNSVAFSPDGEYLASGSADCSVCVWKV